MMGIMPGAWKQAFGWKSARGWNNKDGTGTEERRRGTDPPHRMADGMDATHGQGARERMRSEDNYE
jgi:hypothetical protein